MFKANWLKGKLKRDITEKCAVAFEGNPDFVSCQVLQLNNVQNQILPPSAPALSVSRVQVGVASRLLQLLALTIATSFREGLNRTDILTFNLSKEIKAIDVIESLSLIPLGTFHQHFYIVSAILYRA